MQKPLFDVVLIARNESKTLPRLIESLGEFRNRGGKIFLVDTGSTDNTAQIARDLGCFVEEVGNRFRINLSDEQVDKINNHFIVKGEKTILKSGDSLFDFTNARNFAASLASQDMIAMPDCDEIYTKFDIDLINQAIKDGCEQLEYNFVFAHDQFGNEAVKFMHSKFYNRTKLSWKGIVHEVLKGNAKRQFLDEGVIKLEHWQNHETNRGGYLSGLALDCFQNPENDRNSHYFARELMWNGRTKSAIKEFSRHIAMNGWPAERGQSMIFIGDCYRQLGDNQCIDWYHKAFLVESGRRESLLRLAQYFAERNDHQKVICYASAALQIPEGNFYANQQEDYADKPHTLLYWAFLNLNRRKEAKEHFDKAFAFKPLSSRHLFEYRYFYNLPKVSILIPHRANTNDQRREDGLKKCLESIEKLNYPKELIEVIVNNDPEMNVPKKVKKMWEECSGDIAVYAANDTEFTPDSLVIAVIESQEHGLVAFNTGTITPDEGNICEHFLISRDIVEKIGEIFDTDFHHVGVDNLLWAKCKKLGEAYRSKNAIMLHDHFSKKPFQAMDEVYKLGWSKAEKDRALLKIKLAKI